MNNDFRSRVSAAGLLVCVSVTSAQAEKIDEIAVIGTRSEQALTELQSNISVLASDTLETISAVHIQQALSQVPGVSLQRGNGQESLPAIRSAVQTGAGACGNVLVLEENIPVRGVGFCNVNELFDTHFEQAGRIEVVRGPSSAFYGSNALSGSVNVVLPIDTPNRVALEFGANQYSRASGTVGYRNASGNGRVFLTLTDDGGYRDESGYQQQKFSWRHAAQLGGWLVKAGATFTDLDQETAGFIVGADSFRDESLARQNLDPEAFRQSTSLRTWVNLERELAGNKRFNITAYLRDTETDFLQHFLPGDPLEQNQQTGFGWQSALSGNVANTLSWAVGIDGDISDGELLQTQDAPTPGSAFLTETIPVGVQYDYQVDAVQVGGFGHINWRVSDDWRLLAGARIERTEYDYDNRGLDGRTRDDGTECGFGGCRFSRPADRTDSFTQLSPKLEIQYSPSDQWRFSFAVADSFRAPQATELYRLQREQTVADLDTVTSTSVEVSAQYNGEATRWSVSLFNVENRNVILRDSDFFNVDGARTDGVGVEFSAEQTLSSNWSARVIGSFAEHRVRSDQLSGGLNINGNLIDTAPRFFGSAFLQWRASDQLQSELEVQHIGRYFTDPENLNEYPGHTLLNLRTSYAWSERWTASLRALNLTDKRYAERADFTGFSGERFFPGEPRSFFAELAYEF